MGKVYSLDTYREFKKKVPKQSALQGIEIKDQEGLDMHYKNIEIIQEENAKKKQDVI